MPSAGKKVRHDTSVSMRMPQRTKELIEAAAASTGKSFSAFLTESARQQALDVLLDQAVFSLSTEEADAFARLLAKPPPPSEELRTLLSGISPWES